MILKRNYNGLWFIDIYDSKKKLLWTLVLNRNIMVFGLLTFIVLKRNFMVFGLLTSMIQQRVIWKTGDLWLTWTEYIIHKLFQRVEYKLKKRMKYKLKKWELSSECIIRYRVYQVEIM